MRASALSLCLFVLAALAGPCAAQPADETPWVTYEGGSGPGAGKHIVFVTGDEEYRSEEGMTMLARILSVRHGFKTTVLYAVDPETGVIDPEVRDNIPGLHQLEDADLLVLFIRWRELPDEQMKHIIDYTNSGRPIIGLRTSTHPFAYEETESSPYLKYHWSNEDPSYEGGYGRQVFGETWIEHHGDHGDESTRGLLNGVYDEHPVLKGVQDIWGPTDVYGLRDLPADAEVLVYGQVLRGMEPTSPPNFDKSIMPIAWTRSYTGEAGRPSRVFMTTMGAAVDLVSEDLRRLLVNAAYWAVGMEDAIPEEADVAYVGSFEPTYFGFGDHRKGVRPSDLRLDAAAQP